MPKNTVRMVATRDFKYSTRRLLAGDEFECGSRDAKVLNAAGRAKPAAAPAPLPPVPESLKAAVTAAGAAPPALPTTPSAPPAHEPRAPREPTDLEALRAEATSLGVTFDDSWGARRLKTAISTAKARAQA